MFLWWRVFYGTLGSAWFVGLLRALLWLADRVKPGAALAVLETRVGESWPRHVPGWVNIHISGLLWRLRRRSIRQDGRREHKLRRRPSPLRVGCVGAFSGLLGFPPSLFAAFPPEAELFVYDLQYRAQLAPALRGPSKQYRSVKLETARDYSEAVRSAANAINADDLDLLLVMREKRDAYDLLDHARTPCIAHVCTGSDLLHHPNIDFHLYCQPEADFFPAGNELFCGLTRRPVPGRVVYPAFLCFDPRDLDLDATPPSWEDRLPLVVFHGSLYKLASEDFLNCLFGVMTELTDVDFAFMGRDSDGALGRIEGAAKRWGVERRVRYEGSYSTMRDHRGRVTDPGWGRLLTLLSQARLAPDPWPMGGASARFEAYVMGAPTVHMGLRTDATSWGRPQRALCEVPNLLVPLGTAQTLSQYRSLAIACLRDGAFSDELVRVQRDQALVSCDPSAYWRQILRAFDEWSSTPR